jgi:hypothetical protein
MRCPMMSSTTHPDDETVLKTWLFRIGNLRPFCQEMRLIFLRCLS